MFLMPTIAAMSPEYVSRDDVPEAHAKIFRDFLVNLQTDETGRAILARIGLPKFVAADGSAYQPARDFLKKYAEAFGTLPEIQKETK